MSSLPQWSKPVVIELFGSDARRRRLEFLDADIRELDRLGVDHPIEIAAPGTPEFQTDPLNIRILLANLDGKQSVVVEKLGLVSMGGRA